MCPLIDLLYYILQRLYLTYIILEILIVPLFHLRYGPYYQKSRNNQ